MVDDRANEGLALGNLGLVHDLLGDYEKAIECHQQSLEIAQANGEQSREGEVLGHLGSVYYSLDDSAQAVTFYEKSLAIARKTSNRI